MCPMDKNKKFQSSPVYKSKRLDTAQMPTRRRRDKYIRIYSKSGLPGSSEKHKEHYTQPG